MQPLSRTHNRTAVEFLTRIEDAQRRRTLSDLCSTSQTPAKRHIASRCVPSGLEVGPHDDRRLSTLQRPGRRSTSRRHRLERCAGSPRARSWMPSLVSLLRRRARVGSSLDAHRTGSARSGARTAGQHVRLGVPHARRSDQPQPAAARSDRPRLADRALASEELGCLGERRHAVFEALPLPRRPRYS
jgi:hypothetical protein